MNIATWANGVNQFITDETNYTLGKNAVKTENQSNNPFSESVNTCMIAPKTFNVKMSFDFVKPIIGDKTELDLFTDWFSFTVMNGSVPFEFPKIGDNTKMAVYKITNSPSFSKSGLSQTVSMEWTEYLTEPILMKFNKSVPSMLTPVEDGKVLLSLTDIPTNVPSVSTYDFKISDDDGVTYEQLTINAIRPQAYSYKNYLCMFNKMQSTGTYTVKCSEKDIFVLDFDGIIKAADYIDIGTVIHYVSLVDCTAAIFAQNLYAEIMAETSITSLFNVSRNGSEIKFERKTSGAGTLPAITFSSSTATQKFDNYNVIARYSV